MSRQRRVVTLHNTDKQVSHIVLYVGKSTHEKCELGLDLSGVHQLMMILQDHNNVAECLIRVAFY